MASIVIPENPISWNEQVIYLLNQISISTSGGGSNVNISAFGGTLVTIGQKTMAASMPVVLASDQSLPVGSATSALQGIGNASLASLDADIDVPLSTRLSEASFVGRINTLGQKDMANSTPVVLPSDQSALPIKLADSASIDAFGRLRVGSPETIFDSKLLVDAAPLYWDDQQTSGAGTSSTYNTNQASVTLAVSAATAGTRTRQTFRRFNYQPGKSQLIFLTGVFGAATSGITRRVGYFDQNNGLFFEQTGAGMNVVTRTFTSGVAVDNSVAQASWNIDPMDGTGPSGITLDFTRAQIMIIDFEWLGVGRVRMGWVVDGGIYYCHQFLNTNNLSLVYMSLPNLPIRYEINNDGTGGASGLVQICSSVASEAGRSELGVSFSASRAATGLVTLNDANLYPLIAIRLKATQQFACIELLSLSIICTSTAAFRWAIILNPTVVGTALSFTGITNSAIEADVSRTSATTVTGGTILAQGYGLAAGDSSVSIQLNGDLKIGATIAGVSDILVLAIQRVTGTTETFFGALNWRE